MNGQLAGHPSWEVLVDQLVADHGTLSAVAERLIAGHPDETLESALRALRRLRGRGGLPGGKWGARVLRTFGLPASIDLRLRFMGSYHSRFVDLPVALCEDLIGLWDRPPVSDSRSGRSWIALARATLALRLRDYPAAAEHLALAAAQATDPQALVEATLGLAYLDARDAPEVVPASLDAVPELLTRVDPLEAHALRARQVGQIAHALNRAGRHAEATALTEALPDGPEVGAYARAKRANGLAYGLWKLGRADEAAVQARLAATWAGDAGQVRVRAMALTLLAQILDGTDEGRLARERARAVGVALGDAVLVVRAR